MPCIFKQKTIITLCVIMIPLHALMAQVNSTYSADFNRLIQIVEQLYFQPNSYNFNQMANEYPTTLAAVLGHAMQAQYRPMPQTDAARNRFFDLHDEILMFVSWLAGVNQGKVVQGQALTPQIMWSTANAGMEGKLDQQIRTNFKVQVDQVPNFIAGASLPAQGLNTNQPSSAQDLLSAKVRTNQRSRKQARESGGAGLEENTAINLLGVSADPNPNDFDELSNPDRIIGTWCGTFKKDAQPTSYGEVCMTFAKISQGVYSVRVIQGFIPATGDNPPFRGCRIEFNGANQSGRGQVFVTFKKVQIGTYSDGESPIWGSFALIADAYSGDTPDKVHVRLGDIISEFPQEMVKVK
jgi:hypothetical protein